MRCFAAIVCVVLGLAGCGDDGEEPATAKRSATERTAPPTPTSSLVFVADRKNPLRWTRETYRTETGNVELRVENPSVAVHNVAVEQSSKCCRQPGSRQLGNTKIISPGESTRATVKLAPGRYWAYCGVDGHWQGGMVSTLIVR